ncbi:MAG: response regulator [Kiritimatiellia bacterium]
MANAITPEHIPCAGQRILIADDDAPVRKLFRMILSSGFPNCTIDVACNGAEAVESFQQFHHSVVLLDVKMPVMNGLLAFDKISELCEENKWAMPAVIFCSAFAFGSPVLMRVAKDPRHGFIQKPPTIEIICAAVKARLPAAR